jgi:hypothetical protein
VARRMISTDISTSERWESCSEFAQLLFLLMVAHQDDWGRLVGSPGQVKAKLKPLSRRTAGVFERAIAELDSAGLICWYECEGQMAVALKPASCSEYQTTVHEKAEERHRKSRFPIPPLDVFRWPQDGSPGLSRTVQDNPREPNLTEPNLTQENGGGSRAVARGRPQLTPEQKTAHKAAIDAFDSGIKAHTGLANPPGWDSKAPGHAARFFWERLLAEDTGEDLQRCIAEYFRRKRQLEEREAARGRKITTNASFAQFRTQYTSLLRSVMDA